MTVFTEMRERAECLKARAEEQKRNTFNKQEHHAAMTDGLSGLITQIGEAEAASKQLDDQRKGCERKLATSETRRQRVITLVTQVITHLEQTTFLDGAAGQALALAKITLTALLET